MTSVAIFFDIDAGRFLLPVPKCKSVNTHLPRDRSTYSQISCNTDKVSAHHHERPIPSVSCDALQGRTQK